MTLKEQDERIVSTATYASLDPITGYIPPKKQEAKRHYGSHQYFTKRAWNVVQAYIEHYTRPGDIVCDPYGGSGVTAIEALVLRRRAVYADISPWATFLARQVAVAPVDLSALEEAFQKVRKTCRRRINRYWSLSDADIDKVPLRRWYPKNRPLPKNADVFLVEELFTRRQLLALSELWHHIERTKEPTAKDLLKYAFSATLYMCNRTFISAEGRAESRGGSSVFSIYRYKVAKRPIELNAWDIFERRFGRVLTCKKETNLLLRRKSEDAESGLFITGQAQKLSEYIAPESVDYIFTDPPYGAHIAYLDLTRMWDAWFGFEVSEEDREAEAIEGGDVGHSADDYKSLINAGIREMFKVLKYDRWMSLVFVHREPAFWDAIVKSAEAAGFEYVHTVCQPLNVIWSMHKKKNPLTVLSGELILTFRKVRNPRTLAITSVGSDVVSLIKDSAELTIVERRGATSEQIYGDLIPKLLENGMLGTVSEQIKDINPILSEEFIYDGGAHVWYTKPSKKLGSHIPMDQRIAFYVMDYLNRCVRIGKKATIDDIVFHVLPKLKNGEQPTEQRIMDEIRKIAVPYRHRYWVIPKEKQYTFDFAAGPLAGVSAVSSNIAKCEDEVQHNEVIYALAKLGRAAGFTCHIGKKEQASRWNGEPLADISAKVLRFLHGATRQTTKAVGQIDLLWLDAGIPELAFEVEHSTAFTTGIDRFLELLKACPKLGGHLVLVAPSKRKRKLDEVLSSSHYIGAPMYLERKLTYLWYSQVAEILDRFVREQPNKATLLEEVLRRLHQPESH